MFLHLGNGISVKLNEVITIGDYALYKNGVGLDLIAREKRRGKKIINCLILKDKPKSLILTDKNIYLSPISSLTLKKRAENRNRDFV